MCFWHGTDAEWRLVACGSEIQSEHRLTGYTAAMSRCSCRDANTVDFEFVGRRQIDRQRFRYLGVKKYEARLTTEPTFGLMHLMGRFCDGTRIPTFPVQLGVIRFRIGATLVRKEEDIVTKDCPSSEQPPCSPAPPRGRSRDCLRAALRATIRHNRRAARSVRCPRRHR